MIFSDNLIIKNTPETFIKIPACFYGKKLKIFILTGYSLFIRVMKMREIAIGSKNEAKINAVRSVLSQNIKLHSFDVPSNVSSQPFSDEETRKGAVNRANGCFVHGDFDYAIGLEGGVTESDSGLFLCNWGALVTGERKVIAASGAKILLPDEIAESVRKGTELGKVMAEFTGADDIRKKEGAVGIFTNGYVSRAEMFSHIVRLLVGQYEYVRKMK